MGKKQKNKGDDGAKDEIEALAAEIEGAGAAKEQSKAKSKKKKGKRDDFEEDDILKELEELSLQNPVGKSKEAPKEPVKKSDSVENAEATLTKADKKKSKKGKKASPEDEEGDEDQGQNNMENDHRTKDEKKIATPDPPVAASDTEDEASRSRQKPKAKKKGGRKGTSDSEDNDEDGGSKTGWQGVGRNDESDDDSQATRKKKKGKARAKPESEDEEEEEEAHKMKTAAQKKAEKKERDKKKKEEDRAKLKAKKEKEEEALKKEAEKQAPIEKEEADASVEQDAADVQGEEEADGDKKKKKKKKGEKEEKEKEKKKGPSKAAVKAMQEALAKMKEEEDRAKQEEDERLRREEELEVQRQEQERLEAERKEKKKQKDKERKERLKKEGKLLTKTQKEARARAEATLRALQAQGVEVPSKDSMPRKKPVYSDKRKKKPIVQTPEEIPTEACEVTSTTSETPKPITAEMEVNQPKVEPVKEPKAEAADLDDWEAMVSDEDKEVKKVHIEVKGTTSAAQKPAEDQENGSEGDDEEEDEDEEDEDEDEEESEEEEEKESSNKTAVNKARKEPSSDSSSESDSDEYRSKEERMYDKAKQRIEKRRQENLKNINLDKLRAPVVCVLGHVDTGKTKILDKLRHTHVQDGEAGGITQQIGATNVPLETILEQAKMFDIESVKVPGMLIIDTPGHESFSNLRNRGSSLCDIAILVVDIMHGLEPQTLESINLLKEKKCPFIVALNKIDRLYDWKRSPETDVVVTLKKQKKNTKDEFDERTKAIIVEFAQQGLNAALFYENKDPRTFVSLVPTSAHSGDGMGNLIGLLVELTQTMLVRRLAHCDELRAQVMEVKALPGMGTTIDVILINGCLREGDTIIVPGVDGPIVTQIRGLLLPPPLKELRVKSQYEKHKEVSTAQGVKILGKDLEKTLAGLPLLVAHKDDEIPVLRDELIRELKQTLNSIKLEEKGVYVQASTLGSLEALLEFLRTSKVPYAGINIGPVHKKDVMKASAMLEHDQQYAVILAFDVKIERDSQDLADSLGVRVFSAEIIYHLFDAFTKYRDDYKKQKQDEFKHIAVFPCKLRILPQFIFNSRDPIVMGVIVEAGIIRTGTPVCVPTKGFVDIGIVTGIEINHKSVDTAKKGQEICVKIEPIPGETPKMYGRHFEAVDFIVSKITRQSIDALKNWFRDEMQKSDWQLIMELKKTFEII
ncbi:Eukaryotic translation initiation factor 5B [Triplophysa tibetana]|uniref:Eukaryotic translation initiation factor 5B n=1 Tax=Triplophysa tibetana TaxID=1572043 RepID=A0A5A9PIL6_9TELE|nr:Eukaryotic translation initiation factor 5B [Triplophysa tibetana]